MSVDPAVVKKYAWDESKHKRHPVGTERGGEFAPKLAPGSFVETDDAHGNELAWVKEVYQQNVSVRTLNGRDLIFSKTDVRVVGEDYLAEVLGDDYEDKYQAWIKDMPRYMSYANKIEGVEIFAPGKHNGDEYTERDLDMLIEAFGELDYRPAIKQGHVKDETGLSALGWVENVRKVGGKLLADFVDLPDAVYAAIKDRKLDRVSAEIFWNLKRAGKTFPRALKAVALLGAEIPAVAGLKPLHEHFSDTSADALKFADDSPLCAGTTDDNPRGGNPHKEINMTEEQLKELNDRLEKAEKDRAALEERVAELSKKTDGDGLSELIKRLTDANGQIDVKRLATAADEAERRAQEADKARAAIEAQARESAARVAELSKEKRAREIDRVADSCRIPAFRQFVKQYLDLATREEDVKVYAHDGKSVRAVDALEAMVKWINENAARVFTVYSAGGDLNKADNVDAGKELNDEVQKFRAKNPSMSYADAMREVLASNPGLKTRYLNERGGQAA